VAAEPPDPVEDADALEAIQIVIVEEAPEPRHRGRAADRVVLLEPGQALLLGRVDLLLERVVQALLGGELALGDQQARSGPRKSRP
jgi:hypothetical protein